MTTTFRRDSFTWLAYFMLAYYAYLMGTLGPLIPFLRDELNINYTVSAFYISAFALGMIGAGLTADRVAKWFGRAALFWGGGAGMAIGAVLLAFGTTAPVTIVSTFLMGFLGTYVLVMVQATLSDRHGNLRAYALTESNVFAALASAVAPILVGIGEVQGSTWRLALYIGVVAWVLVFIWTRRHISLPQSASPPAAHDGQPVRFGGKLPRVFWVYWLVVVVSVAIEWCMIFWASTYMETVVGLSKDAAATSLSLFTIAEMLGRAAGSGLTRRYPTGRLLIIAALIVLVGFPLYWLGRAPIVNAVGLFLCGLGVANLFPLTLSVASGVGTADPNKASARVSFGSGMAILIAPQVLGTVADRVGIFSAYGIVTPMVIAVIVLTWYANRLARRPVVEVLAS